MLFCHISAPSIKNYQNQMLINQELSANITTQLLDKYLIQQIPNGVTLYLIIDSIGLDQDLLVTSSYIYDAIQGKFIENVVAQSAEQTGQIIMLSNHATDQLISSQLYPMIIHSTSYLDILNNIPSLQFQLNNASHFDIRQYSFNKHFHNIYVMVVIYYNL